MRSRSLASPLFLQQSHGWQVESLSKADEITLFSWLGQDVDCPVCTRLVSIIIIIIIIIIIAIIIMIIIIFSHL